MPKSIKRILIVDDTSEIRRIVGSFFEDAGFTTDFAKDGAEGLEKIKNNDYDIVLLDIVMPNRTGFEVLSEVKAMGIATPIFVYSNMNEFMSREEALKLGAKEYFEKLNTPLESILKKISNFLS